LQTAGVTAIRQKTIPNLRVNHITMVSAVPSHMPTNMVQDALEAFRINLLPRSALALCTLRSQGGKKIRREKKSEKKERRTKKKKRRNILHIVLA
jgi:hypothetical protein